jgi:peptidoglycan hydrolase-like protein with peptidoglycan-binding domain
MRRLFAAIFPMLVAALVFSGSGTAAGNPEVAALQVALRARGLYAGTVDGVLGASTQSSLRRFQRRAGLPADGVVGPRTRAALGRYAKPAPLGRRVLVRGMRGWDVAALQFSVAWHGFPSGNLDGIFGPRTDAALRRFQKWAGLKADGRAAASTLAALRAPPPRSPIKLVPPLQAPIGDRYGPRGGRFHSGIDFIAPVGVPIVAPAAGRVVIAGPDTSGWGNTVVVEHVRGVRTLHAHLSRIDVRPGQLIAVGSPLGLVGATGNASGPHLHFEVLVRGAAVDPATAF